MTKREKLEQHLLAALAQLPQDFPRWEVEDLAIILLTGPSQPLTATLEALTAAKVDGNCLVHFSQPLKPLTLGQVLLAAATRVGASVDLSPITKSNENLDDWAALCEGLINTEQDHALIAVHPNALPAVSAATEAEDCVWLRIGVTGGEMLVITGDGIFGQDTYTLLPFDVADLAAKRGRGE